MSADQDKLIFASKLPDNILQNSFIPVTLEYHGHSSEGTNEVQIRVSAYQEDNESIEVPIASTEGTIIGSEEHHPTQNNIFTMPESRRLSLSIVLLDSTDATTGKGVILKFIAQSTSGRMVGMVASLPIHCVRYKLQVDDNFPDNYDTFPGQTTNERLFYNAKGGKDKGIKFCVTLVDGQGVPIPKNDVELKLTLLYEGANQMKVDNQQILQADQKKIQLLNGEATIKLRISEVSQKHQGKRFRIKFEHATAVGEVSDIAPGFSEAIEVRSKINYQNKRNAVLLGEQSNTASNIKKSKLESQPSATLTPKNTLTELPSISTDNLSKVKIRCEKIKKNINVLRTYFTQTQEVIAAALPLIRDANVLQLAENLSTSRDGMIQVISSLLADQMAVQNFLEELEQTPQMSEVVDDAAEMLMQLSSAAGVGLNQQSTPSLFLIPPSSTSVGLDTLQFSQFSSGSPSAVVVPSASAPIVRFDEDQQVRMIYLGSITREGLSKGVPAFKKANGNWEMAGFYNFLTVEGQGVKRSPPGDLLINLEKSQLLALIPNKRLSTKESYKNATRAEAVLYYTLNPDNHANIKIDVEFYLVNDNDIHTTKTPELRKRLIFQALTGLPPAEVTKITEYCVKHCDEPGNCLKFEDDTSLVDNKKELTCKFINGLIQVNTFQLDERKVHFILKSWEYDANNQPTSITAYDKNKNKIGTFLVTKRPVSSQRASDLQKKIFERLQQSNEDELIPIDRQSVVEEMGFSSIHRFVLPVNVLEDSAIQLGPMEFIGYSNKPLVTSADGIKLSKFIYAIEFSSTTSTSSPPILPNNGAIEEVSESNSICSVKKIIFASYCSKDVNF